MDFIDPWYIGAGVLIFVVVVVLLMYEKGYLGGKKRLVALIAETENLLAKLHTRLDVMIAKEAAKQPAPIAAPKTKTERRAIADAALADGTLTQAQYDIAIAQIVVND